VVDGGVSGSQLTGNGTAAWRVATGVTSRRQDVTKRLGQGWIVWGIRSRRRREARHLSGKGIGQMRTKRRFQTQSKEMWDLGFSRRWLWRMASSGMLRRVVLVITYVSEEHSASFIRVTRIGELGISSQRESVASYS
jgi:hypothetical protein